jgi:hypothetical protein
MALTSPGVQVSVIDESFYTPAEPGTVPMIFVASAENKANGSGTGVAEGTLAANAGKPYILTSQRDLAELFGDPIFQVDANNNPVHGGELNEYGLQAAYSLLGVSNRVYVARADIDLGSLEPQADEPSSDPADGTNWLDTQNTAWGIFEWNGASAAETNGQSFAVKTPIVITDVTKIAAGGEPKGSVGQKGEYAIKATTNVIKVYYKNNSGIWVEVGSADWKDSWPVIVGPNSVDPTGFIGGTSTFTLSVGTTDYEITEDATLSATITGANTLLANAGSGVRLENIDNKINIFNDGTADETITLAPGAGLGGDLLPLMGLVGTTANAPALQVSAHTSIPEFKIVDTTPRPTGSVWLKTTEPNQGARWRYKRWNDNTKLFDAVEAPIYGSAVAALYGLDRSGGGANLAVGDTFVLSNSQGASPAVGSFTVYERVNTGSTSITGITSIATSTFTAGTYSFTISETDANWKDPDTGVIRFKDAVTVTWTATGFASDADELAAAINAVAGLENIVASVNASNKVVIEHTQGGDINFVDTDSSLAAAGFIVWIQGDPNTTVNLYTTIGATTNDEYTASNWRKAVYTASADAPASLAADGTLWYSSVVDEVDIMVHNGIDWVGYQTVYPNSNPSGPIVSATEPTQQTDASALVEGDLWISTADIENYPQIYRWNDTTKKWVLRDSTDQTTEEGVLFADVRYNTSGANSGNAGTIEDLLVSNYVDPDAPDSALYPKGMLLWNLRRSGFNVKRFVRNAIDINGDNDAFGGESMALYYPHRWVTESANQADGSGSFGRKAQRQVVVQSLQAMVNTGDELRDDERNIFNIMACPGYPELIGEMVSLNYDRGLSAFIVGDSPMRLTPDATSLNEWGTNVKLAVEDNDDGLVSFDEYMGVYYPAGFTSDNAGNNIVVPPSHMALRTIALSDQVSYPWFAPAGTRRGGVTNATATGYINSEGEFVSIALNEGQRDTLYSNAINPITFLSGAGVVVFGQKTRARNASALDRVNVARLVVYLRSQLNKLAKPYLFEPNDKITRDEIKAAAESLMLELVGQRALYDFLVVCDESNNTPSRIDRNELYLDIAIEPVKAVEFIYIPLRLKNTGEIAGL